MIVKETLVQICASGQSRAAGDLEIGDRVFDGFAGKTREIANIIRREVDTLTNAAMKPVRIGWATCGANIPSHDVLLSPRQMVFQSARPHGRINYPALVEPIFASKLRLRLPDAIDYVPRKVEYVALFFEEDTHVVCSGLILSGYTPQMMVGVAGKRARIS
mgnify:CR=1 FL=1